MSSIILAINAGSSSVKLSVFKTTSDSPEGLQQLAEAEVSGVTAPPPTIKYTRGDHSIRDKQLDGVKDHSDAFSNILDHLLNDDGLPELKHKEDIQYACHRIVHGGHYSKVLIIDRETFHDLEEISDLAPLHNTVGLGIVKVVHEQLPKATNMAYFDSAFHASIPRHISTYPIDPKIATHNKLKKYGFHGISYAFITKAVAKHLGKAPDQLNIIALHLGSGASACAIKGGKSLDTSMGLTPLSGLPGGTRSGDIDPSLMFHYTHDAGKPSHKSSKSMHITQAEEIMNKQSGFKALTGTSDFGKISASDDDMCRLTVDLFADRVLSFIGSYYVKLHGQVDALVFAGGIGEKGAAFRKQVVQQAQCLGFDLDEKRNSSPEDVTVADIGSSSSKHRVLVCQTDEQHEMARGCVEEAKEWRSQR